MKNKFLMVLACLILLISCSSCAAGNSKNTGNEYTAPLDHLTVAVKNASLSDYKKAFPESFFEAFESEYSDMNSLIEDLLSTNSQLNEDTYGKNYVIYYEAVGEEDYNLSQLEESSWYFGIAEFTYSLPLEAITDAKTIQVRIYISGNGASATVDAQYLVLCINETWYLHPDFFGTVLIN